MSRIGIAASQITGNNQPGVASGVAFSSITTGVNTIPATMTLGNGSILTTSGTGEILNALHVTTSAGPTQIKGVTDATGLITLEINSGISGDGTYIQFTDGFTYGSSIGMAASGAFQYWANRGPSAAGTLEFSVTEGGVATAATSFVVGNSTISSDSFLLDANDGLQCGSGDNFQIFSFWPLQIYGNRQAAPPALTAGSQGTSVQVFNGQAATATMAVFGPGTNEAAAPTYPGILRIIDGDVTGDAATVPCGLEFMASSFGSGYGFKIVSHDRGGGTVTLDIATRQNGAAWSEVGFFGPFGGQIIAASLFGVGAYPTNVNGVTAGPFTAVTSIKSTGGIVTTLAGTSDERLKIAEPYAGGLDAILAIHPVRYRWNAKGQAHTGLSGEQDFIGFIAQDVQKAIPESITASEPSKDGEETYLSFDDRPIIAALVDAVKTMHAEIVNLRAELNALKGSQ